MGFFSGRKIFVIALMPLLLLFCENDVHGKRMKVKSAKKKYTIPMNRTLAEELHSVKGIVQTVKQDLYDMMKDMKGLHKTLKEAEARISEIEKKIDEGPTSLEEDSSMPEEGPSAQALMKPTDIKENTIRKGQLPRFLEKYTLPVAITAKVGQTVTFRCPATGDPMPRIMWLKNRMLFARKRATTEAVKWKLNLHRVTAEDSGNYTCLLTNHHGYAKHDFFLDVVEATTLKPMNKKTTKMITRTTAATTTTATTTTQPPPRPSPSSRKAKRKLSLPRDSATVKPDVKPKPLRMTKPVTSTKPPPRNRMQGGAPPSNGISGGGRAGGISNDEEICEAKVAAGGTPPSRDCWDLKMYHCVDKSGVYNVTMDGKSYSVYCDMATDGGGWVVFQRRLNGKVNFNRVWNDYKHGFGQLGAGDFWWGNQNLFVFTRDRRMRLRIDMADELNETSVEYDGFWISRESDYFRLNVDGFRGRGGEAFLQPVWEEESHNSMMFSTRDRDRDGSLANCAAHFGGGWWYNDCYSANLNGVYPRENKKKTPSLQWKPWKGPKKFLTKVTMKIRPAIAPSSVTWDFWYPEKDDSFRLHEYYQTHGGCC